MSTSTLFSSPIANEVRTVYSFDKLPELFAVDRNDSVSSDDDSSLSSLDSSTVPPFASLDECLDQYTLVSDIRSRPTKRRRVGPSPTDLRPIAFVRFNTRRGKPKPVTIKALLDSGGSESLVTKKFTKKLKCKPTKRPKTCWTTPAGQLCTSSRVKAEFTLPELNDSTLVKWDLHVTNDLGAYDMIIGRDMSEFLEIDLKFSNQTVEWGTATMPFKDPDASILDSYHIDDPDGLQDEHDRIKKILDAKYDAADLEQVCKDQCHLNEEQQKKLHDLLDTYSQLFDGTLGKWTGSEVNLELKPDATPCHARAYPVPRCHERTLRSEVERLCRIGVLKKVNRSEWAAPSFIIPKKDGTVRFINDFRELNKRIRRKPFPIPNIQDMLLGLEGFQWATSLDLNMGYYHIELSPDSKRLCTVVFPFGKYEMQRLPMGLCNSPDLFQEKMSELMDGLEFVRTYIDDLLCLTKGSFEDHLEKLERVFIRLQQAGLKVNAVKSFFARTELEYLGYWITREGIKPVDKKVQAVLRIAEPKNRKELRSFIGVVNYYRDMWIRRSHILAPLAQLTSKSTKWEWGEKQRKAFEMAKRVIARETMLAYPDFNKPFTIHTDASHYQLGAVISQDGKPIAFYSRKLNPAQTRYTTTERELLSIVETLKEYRTILLGHEIEVYTDHKNLVYKHFNTERVMRWRLLLEEFGPKLTYIKGPNNVVADALSRMSLTEEDFSAEAFAGDNDRGDFPKEFPLSYAELASEQAKDKSLQKLLKDKHDDYKSDVRRHGSKEYTLIFHGDKIVVPKSLQVRATEWYHLHLLHPGETRMELTVGQHFSWRGMRKTIVKCCKACAICKNQKPKHGKYGKLPPKKPETIPWHTLCIDLVGPYKFGHGKKEISLHCLTMIDPATGWFEIAEIPNKRADYIANILEMTWLTRYPWPTEIVMDRGKEFAGEVKRELQAGYPFQRKVITTRNPQANSMVERAHQTLHNMTRALEIKGKEDLDDHFGWLGVLSALRQAMRATVHTTTRATPTQLVFGRDALLNVSFEADWQYVKERKQALILQNNKCENATRRVHECSVGDQVMIKLNTNRKHGGDQHSGPHTVTQVHDNGTLRVSMQDTRGNTKYETWNLRNVSPCLD